MSDDDLLLAKVGAILSSSTEFCDEKRLVTLVLLTRVVDDDKLQAAWSPALATFLSRALLDSEIYVPLVSNLLPRLPEQTTDWEQLSRSLQGVLGRKTTHRGPLDEFDIDLVLSLQYCCSARARGITGSTLEIIWHRFHQVVEERVVPSVTLASSRADMGEWHLVQSTLTGILRETALETDDELVERYNEAVFFMWNSAPDISFAEAEAAPGWYSEMLSWLNSGKLRSQDSAFQAWYSTALMYTNILIDEIPLSFLSNNRHAILKLVLSQISSPSARLVLRWTSWEVLNSLVAHGGRDWLVESPPSSTLGRASLLCTMARMASGEWRIQLGRYCTEGVVLDDDEDAVLNLIGNCAIFLLDQLHNLAQVADDTSSIFPYTPDAILHLRHSLMDTYHATVQYLCQDQQNPKIQMTASTVLGELLTEFDPTETLPEGLTSEEVSQAQEVAAQCLEGSPEP